MCNQLNCALKVTRDHCDTDHPHPWTRREALSLQCARGDGPGEVRVACDGEEVGSPDAIHIHPLESAELFELPRKRRQAVP